MGRKGVIVLAVLAVLALAALLGVDALTGFLGLVPRARRSAPDRPDAATVGDKEAAKPTLSGGAPRPAVALDASSIPPPVDLSKVDRDLDLHGIVVTKDGKPVAGALLTAVKFPWRRASLLNTDEHDTEVQRAQTWSASDGTFAIRLKRGEEVRLRAAAAGFADVEQTGCMAGQRVKIVMAPGVRLLVSVKDETGKPVDAVHLTLVRADHVGSFAFQRRGKTDAQGAYVFENLPGECWGYLGTEHDTFGDNYFVRVVLPAAGEVREEIVLEKGRTITGRVTDADTGAAVPGAKVGSNWTMGRPVAVDADGRYAFPGWLGRNVMEMTAHAEGYGFEEIRVGAAETVDFRLKRGFTVRGRIVDGAGHPVVGSRVSAIASEFGSGSHQKTSRGYASTDADGHFAITGLDPATAHALVVMGDGIGRTLLDFDPPAGRDDLDLGEVRVHVARAIEGRVIDAGGEGVADCDVELRGANADRDRLRPGKPAPNMDYGEDEERRTDDLGRFRFPDLSPGDYSIEIRPRGRPEVTRSVVVSAERDTTDVEVRLADAREVTVIAVDDVGNPVQGAFAELKDVAGESSRAATDASGRARLACGHKPSQASVQYWLPGKGSYFAPPAQEVAEGQEEVRFVLERAGVATGTLLRPDGTPLGSAMFEVRRNDAVVATAYAMDGGRFEANVPLSGAVSLVFSGKVLDGNRLESGPLFGRVDGVVAGATGVTIHTQSLPTDRSIAIRVLAPDGRPAVGALVALMRGRSPGDGKSVDASGVARFTDLAALPASFMALPPPVAGDDGPAWVAATADELVPNGQQVDIRLREGWRLRGKIVDAAGSAASGVRVMFHLGPYSMRSQTTRDDGRFGLVVDPDQTVVKVEARREGAGGVAEASRDVRREDGEVTLTLEPVK